MKTHITLKELTDNNIRKESVEYTKQLANGGQPIQIVISILPGDKNQSIDLFTRIDNKPESLPILALFSEFVEVQIRKAIAIPTPKSKNKRKHRK